MAGRRRALYGRLVLRRRLVRSCGRACVAVIALASAAVAQGDGPTLTLGVGQQKTLTLRNVQRVAIGDPEVADVKQVGGGSELLLTGVGEGRTSLLVWFRNERRASYSVVVRKQDLRELVGEVRTLLGDREGIRVRVVGDKVYLDGETITADDYERVQLVLSTYPQVKSFVRPSANARLLTIGSRRMVLIEVDFVEVASSDNKQVGFKPPLQIVSNQGSGAVYQLVRPLPGDSSTQPAHSLAATLSASTDFSIAARFDSGVQRVLSQPRLLCASGEKAEFTAGGEIPLLVATQNQFAVEFKKFGVILKVTPTADRGGNIATEIHAEVSDVDRSLSVRANGFDVPGLRIREVNTNVTVKDGETIVLSGLYNYDEDKEVSKVPFLGQIPILGELFKSRQFIERKTQLAIYVTPRLVAPDSDRVKELIQDVRKLYQEAESSLTFSLFD